MRPLVLAIVLCAPQSANDYLKSGQEKYRKGDYDGAIADYTKAAQLEPRNVFPYLRRAEAKKAKGDVDGAIADYTKAVEVRPMYSDAFNSRGLLKRGKGDLDGAIADFTEAIKKGPGFAAAHFNRGYTKHVKRDYDGALADIKTSVEMDPKRWDFHRGLGHVYYDRRAFKEALEAFRKAAELDGSDPLYRGAWMWIVRARLGEREAATRDLEGKLPYQMQNVWSSKIAKFVTGQIKEEEFLNAAGDADNMLTRLNRRCIANFFAATRRLIDGEKDKARELFKKCLETGGTDFYEYLSAQVELKALETTPRKK